MEIAKISCCSIDSVPHFSIVYYTLCILISLSLPTDVDESSSEMRRLLAKQSCVFFVVGICCFIYYSIVAICSQGFYYLILDNKKCELSLIHSQVPWNIHNILQMKCTYCWIKMQLSLTYKNIFSNFLKIQMCDWKGYP